MSTPVLGSRPLRHLAELTRRYPNLPSLVTLWRDGKGIDLPAWPDWCFIPMSAWHAVAMRSATPDNQIERAGDIAVLGALAPWRYTQGIYRFDPALLDALAKTSMDGILPSGVLHRLPQWSLYIELPPARFSYQDAGAVHGFWVHLEWDANDGRSELRLLMDTDDGLILAVLHLGNWTVDVAVRRVLREAQRNLNLTGTELLSDDLAAELTANIMPYLSIVLYLCSQEPEIDNEREPGSRPHNPAPKRIKRGWRLFPPDEPTLWHVGATMGVQLRRDAGTEGGVESEGQPRTVRAHLRRAHWHGYWTGPRDPARADERGFVYHWQPPTVIGGAAPPV